MAKILAIIWLMPGKLSQLSLSGSSIATLTPSLSCYRLRIVKFQRSTSCFRWGRPSRHKVSLLESLDEGGSTKISLYFIWSLLSNGFAKRSLASCSVDKGSINALDFFVWESNFLCRRSSFMCDVTPIPSSIPLTTSVVGTKNSAIDFWGSSETARILTLCGMLRTIPDIVLVDARVWVLLTSCGWTTMSSA